jgi:hypothetical protein
VGIAERHPAVVAEDDVEARIRQRHLLRARVQEREIEAGPRNQLPGMLELPL